MGRPRKYATLEEKLAAEKERVARWREAHPYQVKLQNQRAVEKRAARLKAGRLKRSGQIEERPCEVCGAKAEMHHEDYDRPEEVRWLCVKHHKIEHGQEPLLSVMGSAPEPVEDVRVAVRKMDAARGSEEARAIEWLRDKARNRGKGVEVELEL